MSEAPRVQRFSESSGVEVLPVAPGLDTLAIANTVGAVALRGADRGDIRIAWTKRGDPGTPEWDGLELEVERSAARISVRPRHPERSTGRGSAWIDLVIEIPDVSGRIRVEMENGTGGVEATGVSCGSLQLVVASGNALLRGVWAETRVQSASGDVSADAVSGNLTVRSASGDIAVFGHRQGTLTIETASGDVRWRPAGPADARIRTVSGDIVAELPAGSGWRIDFRSVSGAASLPPRFGAAGRKAWVANGPETAPGTIEARTVSGDLQVTDAPAAASDATESPNQRSPRSRDAILRAVERGDLGIDDALRLLDDLPGGAQPA